MSTAKPHEWGSRTNPGPSVDGVVNPVTSVTYNCIKCKRVVSSTQYPDADKTDCISS